MTVFIKFVVLLMIVNGDPSLTIVNIIVNRLQSFIVYDRLQKRLTTLAACVHISLAFDWLMFPEDAELIG